MFYSMLDIRKKQKKNRYVQASVKNLIFAFIPHTFGYCFLPNVHFVKVTTRIENPGQPLSSFQKKRVR